MQCSKIDILAKLDQVYYTKNDRDITERVQGYMLQDASFMHQSRC